MSSRLCAKMTSAKFKEGRLEWDSVAVGDVEAIGEDPESSDESVVEISGSDEATVVISSSSSSGESEGGSGSDEEGLDEEGLDEEDEGEGEGDKPHHDRRSEAWEEEGDREEDRRRRTWEELEEFSEGEQPYGSMGQRFSEEGPTSLPVAMLKPLGKQKPRDIKRLQRNSGTRALIDAALTKGGVAPKKGIKKAAIPVVGAKINGKRSHPDNVVPGHQSRERGEGKRVIKLSARVIGSGVDE